MVNLNEILSLLQNYLLDDQIFTSETERLNHSEDESYHLPKKPLIVVYPRSKEDVIHIMHVSNITELPIIPYGRGSSLEGHIIPIGDAMTIDFSEMNKIIEIRPDDMLVVVQPGVGRIQLNQELKKHGLFFSVDPGADASIGGMVATNASGTTSVKYGVMRDQVRDLEIVLANGDVIHSGNLAAKSSSGYHLNSLFVGSEGTLGCFTEITLRVFGIPEFQTAARASFKTVEQAIQASTLIRQSGIPVARLELLDEISIKQVNAYSNTHYKEAPTLFLEFHGNRAGLKQDIEFTSEILKDFDVSDVVFVEDTKDRNELWEARHNLAYAFIQGYKDKKMMTTDVCVPISQLASAIHFTREQLDENELIGGILGHVGDGNYHVSLMASANEMDKASHFNRKIVEFALAVGGTCTGEHGVGVGKLQYQKLEHGQSYETMRMIKKMFDSKNLLNPGKLISFED